MSETAKQRHLTRKYCYRDDGEPGCGVDIASQGDSVVPWAMALDLPRNEFVAYCGHEPPKGLIQLEGHGDKLPFADESLDFVYCLPGDEIVHTPSGDTLISSIKVGDYVLGRTGFTKVITTFERAFRGRIVSLETSKGILKVTENHPIATPLGWSRADQLRKADVVIHSSSKVELPQFCHSAQVFDCICRDLEVSAPWAIARRISESNASLAKAHNDTSLGSLSIKERAYQRQELQDPTSIALEEKTIAGLSTSMPRFERFGINPKFNSMLASNVLGILKQSEITIRDLDSRNDTSFGCKTQAYAALAINQASKPSKPQIAFGRVNHVSKHTYNGDVFNLKTEDGTFFAGNILTHNCSHLLEDFPPEDRLRVMREWLRVLRPGGNLVIMVPERARWAYAITVLGQCPNCRHAREPELGELSELAKQLGIEVLEERLTECHPNDYNILFAGRKRD